MTTTLYTVSGQTFWIGSAAVDLPDDDLVAADFDSVTWIQVKNWSQMGASGDAAALVTTPLIDRQRDIKQKGTRNAGQMQNNFAIVRSDTGQMAMRAAEATDLNYPFRIIGNDEPAVGSAPAPSQRLFYGLVMSAQEAGGGANTGMMLNTTTEINTNIVTVQPTTGSAPVNVTLPAISGIAADGETLTIWPGVWTGGVDSYTYQWRSAGVNIGGATSSTYLIVTGDVGDPIDCIVTAVNGAGSTPATTAPTVDVGA